MDLRVQRKKRIFFYSASILTGAVRIANFQSYCCSRCTLRRCACGTTVKESVSNLVSEERGGLFCFSQGTKRRSFTGQLSIRHRSREGTPARFFVGLSGEAGNVQPVVLFCHPILVAGKYLKFFEGDPPPFFCKKRGSVHFVVPQGRQKWRLTEQLDVINFRSVS